MEYENDGDTDFNWCVQYNHQSIQRGSRVKPILATAIQQLDTILRQVQERLAFIQT